MRTPPKSVRLLSILCVVRVHGCVCAWKEGGGRLCHKTSKRKCIHIYIAHTHKHTTDTHRHTHPHTSTQDTDTQSHTHITHTHDTHILTQGGGLLGAGFARACSLASDGIVSLNVLCRMSRHTHDTHTHTRPRTNTHTKLTHTTQIGARQSRTHETQT